MKLPFKICGRLGKTIRIPAQYHRGFSCLVKGMGCDMPVLIRTVRRCSIGDQKAGQNKYGTVNDKVFSEEPE
jgi:hypothetical protein